MAAVESSSSKTKYLPKAPMVDMTPMVDLGFLLITFFIFTTTVQEDKALKYNTPIQDNSKPMVVKCTKTITLKPATDGKVAWIDCVDGVEQLPIFADLYKDNEIRQRLQDKRQAVSRIFGDPKDLFVIIRPDSSCSYQTLIDLIDEMTINEVTRYAIVDE